jgi:hypothetical protein
VIQGNVQTTKTNDWGFTSYKVQGTWYGADSKGPPRAAEGESITFEAYNKAGKDGREWPTIKLSTLRKVSGGQAVAGTTGAASAPRSFGGNQSSGAGTGRDSYWSDKANADLLREPRIAYQGAIKLAISFVDLAISSGSFVALSKVKKDTDKLEVLEKFVTETAERFFKDSWNQKAPIAEQAKAAVATEQPVAVDGALDESEWE